MKGDAGDAGHALDPTKILDEWLATAYSLLSPFTVSQTYSVGIVLLLSLCSGHESTKGKEVKYLHGDMYTCPPDHPVALDATSTVPTPMRLKEVNKTQSLANMQWIASHHANRHETARQAQSDCQPAANT